MSYEPSFTAETAAEDIDRKLLSPTSCAECGAVLDNSLSDVCCWCAESDDDDFDDDPNQWVCAFPESCVMPGEHMRSECHTAADCEAEFEAHK
jgi:hypothetical protein